MRKTVIAVLLLALTAVTAPAMAETVTVAADVWCPYNCEPGSAQEGFGIDILRRVFKDQGITLEYKVVDWDTAIEETRAGKHNAIIGAAKDDAPDFVFPDNEFAVSSNYFFVLRDSKWKYTGVDSLAGRKVGIIESYAYSEKLDAYFADNPKGVHVASGDTPLDDLIGKLMAAEVDTVIEDNFVFLLKLRQQRLFSRISSAGSASDSPVYIAFSPKNPKSKKYAEIVSKGIDSLRKSGELKKVLASYGLEDWKK